MPWRALVWRFRVPATLVAFVSLVVATAVVSSCQQRGQDLPLGVPEPAAPAPTVWRPSPRPSPPSSPSPSPPLAAIAPRVVALDHEPEIAVLLASAPRLVITLRRTVEVVGGGQRGVIAPGPFTVDYSPAGVRLVALAAPAAEVVLSAAGSDQPVFTVTTSVPPGKPQLITGSGNAVLRADHASRQVQLIERLPLEQYLAGVLPVEMNPSWPVEALAAQATAARSYACARWIARQGQPWHLHWHYTVDMAYGGWRARTANVRAALERSRGQVLLYQGAPVLALFHASSGGATESAAHIFPGTGSAAAAMRSAVDPAAETGAQGLNLTATHWRWTATIPLTEVTSGLQEWAREKPTERPRFGTVISLRTVDRWPDSGRVAHVSIRHRQGKREADTVLPASDFRLAVGPGVIRSTWWDRCVLATSKGQPALVLAGRGYGHGVGLSQVSAWSLARSGLAGEDILARFYPGAAIERRW